MPLAPPRRGALGIPPSAGPSSGALRSGLSCAPQSVAPGLLTSSANVGGSGHDDPVADLYTKNGRPLDVAVTSCLRAREHMWAGSRATTCSILRDTTRARSWGSASSIAPRTPRGSRARRYRRTAEAVVQEIATPPACGATRRPSLTESAGSV